MPVSPCSQCAMFEECSVTPGENCPRLIAPPSPQTLSKDALVKLPKHLRRAYHVSKVAKNIFEDPLDEAAQLRHWHTIACTARLQILAMGSETKEMAGTRDVVDALIAKRDALQEAVEDLESELAKMRAAMRLIAVVANEECA